MSLIDYIVIAVAVYTMLGYLGLFVGGILDGLDLQEKPIGKVILCLFYPVGWFMLFSGMYCIIASTKIDDMLSRRRSP